jgi:hypothetical protein
MASGQQIAEHNFQLFDAWRARKLDQDFCQMVSRGVLSRKEIAKGCGFAKSALNQNPRIKALLKQTEDDLRLRGILPPLENRAVSEGELPVLHDAVKQHTMRDNERLKRLEQENASLHAENAELKRQLQRFTVLQEALALSGRLPR